MELRSILLTAALALGVTSAGADTVKVGVIGPFSGPFASAFGAPFRQGIEAYVAMNGDTVDGNKVEFVYRDLGLGDPARARTLAQELINNQQLQYLAGFVFTPNALPVAPRVQRAKIPTVIFNASTPVVVSQPAYFLRTSNTFPQLTIP